MTELNEKKFYKVVLFAKIIFGIIISFFCGAALFFLLSLSMFERVYVWCAVLSTLVISVFLVFKLKVNKKLSLPITLIYFVVVLWTLESFIPIDPLFQEVSIPRFFVVDKSLKFSDRRSKDKVLEDFKKKGIEAYPVIHPSQIFQFENKVPPELKFSNGSTIVPLGGISNVTTLVDKEQGEWNIVETDEYGLNNPKGLYNPGQVDIVFLGDSFTYGVGVGPKDNIAAVIREKYSHTISLGSAGRGPLSELVTFREVVELLKPKHVVWIYYEGNDLSDLCWESSEPQYEAYYLQPDFRKNLFFRQPEVDQMLRAWERRVESTRNFKSVPKKIDKKQIAERLRKTMVLARIRILLGLTFIENCLIPCPPLCYLLPPYEPDDRFVRILEQVKRRTESWGGKLYFVAIPRFAKLRQGVRNPHYDYVRYRDGQLAIPEKLSIPTIDLYPVFLSQSDPLSFFPNREDGHFNKKGNRFVANLIVNMIENGGK